MQVEGFNFFPEGQVFLHSHSQVYLFWVKPLAHVLVQAGGLMLGEAQEVAKTWYLLPSSALRSTHFKVQAPVELGLGMSLRPKTNPWMLSPSYEAAGVPGH